MHQTLDVPVHFSATDTHQCPAIPFVPTASYPPRSGNLVRPLIDGEPAFRRICEAIEAAHRSVLLTVTFMWAAFEMPDGRGTALDVLRRAAARGLDVRLICWRPDRETEHLKANAFWGSEDHFKRLRVSGSGLKIRWDRAEPGFFQHQKSWLIDAGEKTEIAFVGGMNLNPHSVVAPGHLGEGQNHEITLELVGRCTVDVHHNFVQRWNEASERHLNDGLWGVGSDEDLPFPTTVPNAIGDAVVQIQRTVHSGRYTDGHPTPGGSSFDIFGGERSNLDQYRRAISAARRSIYVEQGSIAVPEVVAYLDQALQREVAVTLLLSADQQPSSELSPLAAYDTFTLAGIAGVGPDGKRNPIAVQAKLMIVDDVWFTVGSCNLRHASFFGSTELNAACWHPETARRLRVELLWEHLGRDTSTLDDLAAFRLFRMIAMENRRTLDNDDSAWQGLAFSLLAPV